MKIEREGKTKPNRLIKEKSPYLLQHAFNPVDWHPWSHEAFDKARAENKPVFVSIGYSSCHWCHVMEQECFEDKEVAKLLNDTFVCIKIDREERPDLDMLYMAACQVMGKNCGWPLNILMTPRKNPFFAASYIPKYTSNGIIGMVELIPQVAEIWRSRPAELEIAGADIKSRVEAMEIRNPRENLGEEILKKAYERLMEAFDEENGGFGSAPKFPRPHILLFILRYWKRSGEENALKMVEKTLTQMRLGGIYDQLGFGFHRYSTDARWLVPHFEKMLYDQALMALAYVETFQATGLSRYALAAREILDYVSRDLAFPEGGFYSAQDADSEGEEGKFYIWTLNEVLDALTFSDADLAVHIYGLLPEGNFPAEQGKNNGENILHFDEPLDEVAPYKGLTLQELISRVHSIRNALFEERKKRVAPEVDKKVLTDWNGLMIAAFAKVGSILSDGTYIELATKAADFILGRMRSGKVLYHRFAEGERAVEGFLDDYAFFVFGLIEIYEASFDKSYLDAASELTEEMNTKFWDEERGGFYFSSNKPKSEMPRMKQVYDGALPSGNSMALMNLLRLSRLVNSLNFEQKANMILKIFSAEVQSAPQAYAWLLSGAAFAQGPSYSVVLVGDPNESDFANMLDTLKSCYLPNTVILQKNPDKLEMGYSKIGDFVTAYICRDKLCLPPITRIKEMLRLLGVEENVKSNQTDKH